MLANLEKEKHIGLLIRIVEKYIDLLIVIVERRRAGSLLACKIEEKTFLDPHFLDGYETGFGPETSKRPSCSAPIAATWSRLLTTRQPFS